MGITITVGGIAGIPLLVLSGPIIEKIGHANVLFIGFVFYAVRLLGEYIGNLYAFVSLKKSDYITSTSSVLSGGKRAKIDREKKNNRGK